VTSEDANRALSRDLTLTISSWKRKTEMKASRFGFLFGGEP